MEATSSISQYNSTNPSLIATNIATNIAANKGDQKCFHGFSVADKEVTISTFDICRTICEKDEIIVHEAQCQYERKCKLAIKQYKFISSRSRRNFETEVGAFKILKQAVHENFIDYFGSVSDDRNGYIVLELGIETLWEYLVRNKYILTIAQINNIAYQMFSMAVHMRKIGFIPTCHMTNNILICPESLLKAIDFEAYTLQGSELFESRYRSELIYAGMEFFFLQLNLKCISENSDYNCSSRYFYDIYADQNFDDFTPELARSFVADEKIWQKNISELQREFIAQCFICDKNLNQEFYHELKEKLKVFEPRESLIPS